MTPNFNACSRMQMKNKVLIAVRIIHSNFLSNHNEIAIINPSADTPLNFYRLIYIYFRKNIKIRIWMIVTWLHAAKQTVLHIDSRRYTNNFNFFNFSAITIYTIINYYELTSSVVRVTCTVDIRAISLVCSSQLFDKFIQLAARARLVFQLYSRLNFS